MAIIICRAAYCDLQYFGVYAYMLIAIYRGYIRGVAAAITVARNQCDMLGDMLDANVNMPDAVSLIGERIR